MQFLITEIYKMSSLRAKPGLSFHILFFRFKPSFPTNFGLNLDRHLVVRLVENHLWLELYGSHTAKAIRFHFDLIVRLLGIGGLRPALLFALALFTHGEEDRAGDNKHQCAHKNLSHDSSPLSIFKL